jgi:aspartyl-tRNA(Asn)/glutamyl-tRNA(Gln) amidotransferase subunit B
MNTVYIPTIGLEIHAELKTASKMFCGCANAPHESAPNTHVCPVCMAHPGTLPVVNKEAVRHVARIGAAVGGSVADFTEFDRKNYFYPDIPKNYQISQYAYPIVSGGVLHDVALTRIHLEEDTARSSHGAAASVIDFNRAGVPLMELVTEPVMHDTETVLLFARDLQLLLRYLGASDAQLEKGEMRIEVNISLAKVGAKEFGTKVEVKNLNSFRAVAGAVQYEIDRHTALLDRGEPIAQETRGWDEQKQITVSQRSKESAHDYRYFPDPDIPKYVLREVPELDTSLLRTSLPELPWEVRERLTALGLAADAVELLVGDTPLRDLFSAAHGVLGADASHVRLLANYITSDVVGLRNKYENIDISAIRPEAISEIITLVSEGEVSSRGAKNLLEYVVQHSHDSRSVKEIAQEKELLQISDVAALALIVEEVLKEHASAIVEYQKGKENALQFLVGQCMRASRGAGNPQKFQELIGERCTP